MPENLPVIDTNRRLVPLRPPPPRHRSPSAWPLILGVALFFFALGYFAGREHVRWEMRRAASEMQRAGSDLMRSLRGR